MSPHETALDRLLDGVLSQPTAPFRESWVKRKCLALAHELHIPVYEDSIGNLWANAKDASDVKRAEVVFVAHLDHPGIVITKFTHRNGRVLAHGNWLGGGPMDIRNFEVKVFSDANAMLTLYGKVLKHTKGPRGPARIEIEIAPSAMARAACTARGLKSLGPWGACLWYSRQGVSKGIARKNGLLVTKAADDLVGACAAIEALRRSGSPRGTVVLLTRAEESGFHGALAVIRGRLLNHKRAQVVSIETSAQLPGAELGKGPVVRLGDRSTIFTPRLVHWVQEAAINLAKRDRSFRYQRRVMDGGSCEATAFNAFGFEVAGLSTPLKNYHNQSKSGRPLPEAVALADVEQLASLLACLMRTRPGKLAFKTMAERLMANLKTHERYFDGF